MCADSRTIYKGLTIGTAKPTATEQEGVPHYGIDIIDPDEQFSAADFQKYAEETVRRIRSVGQLPIIVGGTGLYVDGYLYRYVFGGKADQKQRQTLEKHSVEELQQLIMTRGIEMPENLQNKRYLIRAIEQNGINRTRHKLTSEVIIVGIDPGKEELERRIVARADGMFMSGVVEESRHLFERYGYEVPAASGNIYRALRPHFEQGASLEDCKQRFIMLDRQLARRQRTWFRRNADIHWFNDAASAASYLETVL